MNEPPSALFRRWVHSFEEDDDGITAYRPHGHPFPPARGRRGMEFAADGTFTDHPIGRGDALDSVPGLWQTKDGSHLAVSFPAAGLPGRELEIVSCDEELLRLRE
ncbi:hypothetical protein FHS39_004749 [Streptomyces olivoverticillatus]|uniref:Uncharacterized protein n=1 Tax=Streptomyces olivoverticillatus TaxID=66427 RepID=A0A7W7PPB2_9ACTN|nr:hypothetical protein [Streptomyces olivoverticillatus]MBB4895670.1 hypothetical protein [Streptomyces olivoverticillatus]